MDYGETLHVDSSHSEGVVFFVCVNECTVVMVTKSGHVEKGDNFVHKHFSELRTRGTGSSDMFPSLVSERKVITIWQKVIIFVVHVTIAVYCLLSEN